MFLQLFLSPGRKGGQEDVLPAGGEVRWEMAHLGVCICMCICTLMYPPYHSPLPAHWAQNQQAMKQQMEIHWAWKLAQQGWNSSFVAM